MKKIIALENGFSLLELLVVMTISGILLSLGITQYNRFNRSQVLTQTARNLISDLRMIQNKAITGEMPEGCLAGKSLEGYQVSFTASDYSLAAVCDEIVNLKTVSFPSGYKVTYGQASILFKVFGLGTDVAGAASITLENPFGQKVSVVVTGSGEIR